MSEIGDIDPLDRNQNGNGRCVFSVKGSGLAEGTLKYERLALWLGHRWFKQFARALPEEFRSAACLAAVLANDIETVNEAGRVIRRELYRAFKDCGYRRSEDGVSWQAECSYDEAISSQGSGAVGVSCAVETCTRVSSNNDLQYGRLCRRCFLYVNKRKRKNLALYEGIEENAAREHQGKKARPAMTESEVDEQKEALALVEGFHNNVLPFKAKAVWRKPRCPKCANTSVRFGKTLRKIQRWRCLICRGTFVDPIDSQRMIPGFILPDIKIQLIVHLLCEGIGLRAVARVLKTTSKTVGAVSRFVGDGCERFLLNNVKGVSASHVEADELWTYVFKKNPSQSDLAKRAHKVGSTWIYFGLERESRLICAYHIGRRTLADATAFMQKLRAATVGQLTVHTDGFQPYPTAVYCAFLHEGKIEDLPDFLDNPSMVVRNDGTSGFLHGGEEIDYHNASTNHTERFHGTLRNGLKRLARRTYCFSKTERGLADGVSMFIAYYNFCKKHGSLKDQTPAMVAGLTDHVWSVPELIAQIQKVAVATPDVGAEPIVEPLVATA